MILGFQAGRYKNESYFLDKLKFFVDVGANGVEIHPRIDSPNDFNISEKCLNFLKDNFEYISLHAPVTNFRYDSSEDSTRVYKIIDFLVWRMQVKNVVVHPDIISRIDRISNRGWPICFENMDKTKEDGKTADQLGKWFEKLPTANLVMDLNHVYTIDPTMKLADVLIKKFKSKISEFHISGYINKNRIHEPFTQANCDIILEKVFDKSIPLIIELFTDDLSRDVLKKEFDYVRAKLS